MDQDAFKAAERNGNKVLVIGLPDVDLLFLFLVVCKDDHICFIIHSKPADMPCSLVEEVTHEVFTLPVQGIQIDTVLYGVRAVRAFVQFGCGDGTSLVVQLVLRFNGTAFDQERFFAEVVDHGSEVVHARVNADDPLWIIRNGREFNLVIFFIIKGDEDVISAMGRFYFRLDILLIFVKISITDAEQLLAVDKTNVCLAAYDLELSCLVGVPCRELCRLKYPGIFGFALYFDGFFL